MYSFNVSNLLLALQIFTCWFMAGAIWLVQVLVYPNFSLISRNDFKIFHQRHLQKITWVVAPVMVTELITAVLLCAQRQNLGSVLNLGTVAALWALTFFVNVPCHNSLAYENPDSLRKLVARNWPRTILWSLRSVAWLVYLGRESQ